MPPQPATPHQDFADWLPPVLVKELRQGLRTNLFVAAFVILQGAMIVLSGLGLSANGWQRQELDGYMWAAISIVLLLIMPARGLSAIKDEEKARTLDLVQLTHLSSFRIVTDKWLALAGQSLLFVIALLPYEVLRYFFGGVDVVHELMVIGLLFVVSLPVTALCVTLSTASRGVGLLVFLLLLIFIGGMTIAILETRGRSFITAQGYATVLACLMGTLFALSVTAARISTVAENASARMRLIALASALLVIPFHWFGDDAIRFWRFCSTVIVLWAAVEAMTEQTCQFPTVYAAWVRRGWLGRLAGRVLYPGWATGLFFVGLVTLCYGVEPLLPTTGGIVSDTESATAVASAWHLGMTMLFPVILLAALPRMQHRKWAYVGVQAMCFVYWMIVSQTSGAGRDALPYLTPLSAFLANQKSNSGIDADAASLTLLVDGGVLMFAFFRSRAEFRRIRELEREAEIIPSAG